MLLSLIIIPILGIIHLLYKKEKGLTNIQIGLIYTIINLYISLTVWLKYNSTELGYQQIEMIQVLRNTYEFNLGIDGVSIYFVLLTTITMPLMVMTTSNKSSKTYIIIVLLLESLLITSFLVLDLILFYIFFESILPPLFILIKLYGSAGRIKASYHLFLYTLAGSLFMLIGFMTIFAITKTTDYIKLSEISIDYNVQKIVWLLIFISIMVKSPLWPFTLWLKLAHAEAPLGGSVLLAGVILKLALYAVIRIMLKILPEASIYYSPLIYTLCIITIIYVSLSTLRQIDLKVIIALSSISHLAVTILGAFSNELIGISGSIILGLTHGLVSPGLFILLGGALYERYHTRTIMYYQGLTQFMPIFSVMLFVFILGNMGTPLTGNFIGEFMSLSGSFLKAPIGGAIASSSIFLSAAFSIYLYNRITGGTKTSYLKTSLDLNRKEVYILLPLIILTIIIGIYPKFIQENLNYCLSGYIYNIY